MARSSGPMLTVGGLTLINEVLINKKDFELRIPIATGVAVGFLALIEKGSESLAVGMAYLALIASIFVQTRPDVEPIGSAFANWWKTNFGK
jgi:hypothetical protein